MNQLKENLVARDASNLRFDILPVILQQQILQNVDAKTLLQTCALVCRSWNNLVGTVGFWRGVCLTANPRLPVDFLEEMDVKTIAKIAYLTSRNFVKNPSGEFGFEHWSTKVRIRDSSDMVTCADPTVSFQIENRQQDSLDIPVCFASLKGFCVKEQIVDLYAAGLPPDLMALGPSIVVSEYHTEPGYEFMYTLTARLCESYNVTNHDLDRRMEQKGGAKIDRRIDRRFIYNDNNRRHRLRNTRISRHWSQEQPGDRYQTHFSETAAKTSTRDDAQVVDGVWRVTTLVFPAAPAKTRYVVVTSTGNDWIAGRTKMARARVVVSFASSFG